MRWPWHKGKQSLERPSHRAKVCKYDEHIRTDKHGNKSKSYTTTLLLKVEGESYRRTFRGVLKGPIEIFFNPNDPAEFVLRQGVKFEHMGTPVFLAILTGVFTLSMGAVCFSPQE